MSLRVALVVHSVDVCEHGVRRLTLESRPGSGAPPVAVVDVPGCLRGVAPGREVELRVRAYDVAVDGGGLALGAGAERGDLDEVAGDAEPGAESVGSVTLCGPVFSSGAEGGAWSVAASAGGLGMAVVSCAGAWDGGVPLAEGARAVWCVDCETM